MTKEHLNAAIEKVSELLLENKSALKRVNQIDSSLPDYPLIVDGLIKRFEVLFEYTWKLLKIAANFQGSEAPGPRIAIQEGIKYGWIDDPEFWALALDTRNASVHDYLTLPFNEYHQIIEQFVKDVEKLLGRLKKL